MRDLNFKCTGQRLIKNGDFSGIVPGSKGYLRVTVDFDTDWKNMTSVMEFRAAGQNSIYPVVIRSGTCDVPDDVTDDGRFYVRIIGKKGNQKIRTNELMIRQEG